MYIVKLPWQTPGTGRNSLSPMPASESRDEEGTSSGSSLSPPSAPATPLMPVLEMVPESDPDDGSAKHQMYPTALDVPPVTAPPPNSSVFVYPTRSLLAGVQRDTGRKIAAPCTPSAGTGEVSRDYFQAHDAKPPSRFHDLPQGNRPKSLGPPLQMEQAPRPAESSTLESPESPIGSYGSLRPRISIVRLPPIETTTDAQDEPIDVDEPESDAKHAQQASEARERQLEDAVQQRDLMTTRFEHERDEEGNHIIVGHTGRLTRCEDEPIRIPGAVQAFGVLMALRQTEHSGFQVRQVSENSLEILGLSPKYLFNLDCFTDILPEDQAERLLHNLEFLSNLQPPIEQMDPADQTPQLLELFGFGEPGSALPGDASDELGRRRWHCACALHCAQPVPVSDGAPPRKPFLVLEFELYDDTINPMTPRPQRPPMSTASSTGPDTGTGTASSTHDLTSLSPPTPSTRADTPASWSEVETDAESIRKPSVASVSSESDISRSPTMADIRESTTMFSKLIPEIERLRDGGGDQQVRINSTGMSSWPRHTQGSAQAMSPVEGSNRRAWRQSLLKAKQPHDVLVDMVSVLNQCNEQLTAAPDLESFLKIVVGLTKYLTGFHRVLVYQFDDEWNGQTVAELVDRTKSKDIFRGLHFPASDIPKQARDLYAINKVRLLYDRDQPSARLVCKSEEDLEWPLDMTHSFLRAMSPIHLKYLANMGVRSSMSISIMGFNKLWGLIACHSYGDEGMRVSFHMRHMLRLFADAVSRNLERLTFTQRLQGRKLLTASPTAQNPSGYIVSNAEDLLTLFEAEYGILIVGDGAKIMGENVCGQELLIVAEYLRLKQYRHMFATKSLADDYPDLYLPSGPDVLAGMLYVPLTPDGKNFIAFLRKTQVQYMHWAGQPIKKENEYGLALNPRDSFETWTQRVYGQSREWASEQLDTAAVLSLVYGKFIEVWREKQSAVEVSKLTQLLLSNASHEVRTPLNQIINFLELAMSAPLDDETRENLIQTHEASKSLLFTINDLLDLTRLETGQETSFKEPFELPSNIIDATKIYQKEAARRKVAFILDTATSPEWVWGDAKKIRTVMANLTANAVKYTTSGSITVACRVFEEPGQRRAPGQVVVEVSVQDTGCGIPEDKLGSLFRQIEHYQHPGETSSSSSARADDVSLSDEGELADGSVRLHKDRRTFPLGLGLAVVARIIQQLGGQLRVESKVNEGSTFKFLLPFLLYSPGQTYEQARQASAGNPLELSHPVMAHTSHSSSSYRSQAGQEIEGFVQALGSKPGSSEGSTSMMAPRLMGQSNGSRRTHTDSLGSIHRSAYGVVGNNIPVQGLKIEDLATDRRPLGAIGSHQERTGVPIQGIKIPSRRNAVTAAPKKLRLAVVDDDILNRRVLSKRLERDEHAVIQCGDGADIVDIVAKGDYAFDCIFMDIQMPLMNGYDATKRIREIEQEALSITPCAREQLSLSRALNGRIPVVAVSASLKERERNQLLESGIDGWLLKPINYKRVGDLLRGVHDRKQRALDIYRPGCSWEGGGWLNEAPDSPTVPCSPMLLRTATS